MVLGYRKVFIYIVIAYIGLTCTGATYRVANCKVKPRIVIIYIFMVHVVVIHIVSAYALSFYLHTCHDQALPQVSKVVEMVLGYKKKLSSLWAITIYAIII